MIILNWIRRRDAKRDENEMKLLRKFTIIIISFMTMTFPYNTVSLYEAITGEQAITLLSHISINLLNLNFVLNPYLLYFLDSTIKQQVNQVFKISPVFSSESNRDITAPPTKIGPSIEMNSNNEVLAPTVIMFKDNK
jgi:hypothetical protein